MCLPALLDTGFRAEIWTTQRNRPLRRWFHRRLWRQRFDRTHPRFAAMHQEELWCLPPASRDVLGRYRPDGRIGSALRITSLKKNRHSRLFANPSSPPDDGGMDGHGYGYDLCFRQEPTPILISGAALAPPVDTAFEQILVVPQAAASVFAGDRNLEDARLIAHIGLAVLWDDLNVTWKAGYLNFNPWAWVFISDLKRNMRFRKETVASRDFDTRLSRYHVIRRLHRRTPIRDGVRLPPLS